MVLVLGIGACAGLGALAVGAVAARGVSAADFHSPVERGFEGRWLREVDGASRGGDARALARSASGALAIGDESGASWFPPPGPSGSQPRQTIRQTPRRASLPPVRDLAFDRRGDLWLATSAGLYRWAAGGRPERRPLRGGEASPGLNAIAVSGPVLIVAGASGAYWSSSGAIFQPLDVGGIGAAVEWVALRRRPPGMDSGTLLGGSVELGSVADVWLLGPAGLYGISGLVTPTGLRVLERGPLVLPRPLSEARGVGLVMDPSNRMLAVVYPDRVALREPGSVLGEPGPALGERGVGPRWRWVRPVLTPGAEIRSMTWASDRIVLATDHGVFAAKGVDAPFGRTPAPVGTGHCAETLAPIGPWPWVALCRSGVYAFRDVSGPEPTARPSAEGESFPAGSAGIRPPGPDLASPHLTRPSRAWVLPPDPPVGAIRRRAWEQAGLTAERSASLWGGLRRRAYWPEVELRFETDFDRDRTRDYDQSFISGDTRDLVDSGRDRSRGFSGTVSLDWDLGGLVYPLESVDLSRELRQVVSLRDDVADEINQLYFERQRLRQRLSALHRGAAPTEVGEAERLRLRADEIEAGLDAWTGGWMTRWRRDRSAGLVMNSHPEPPVPIDKDTSR